MDIRVDPKFASDKDSLVRELTRWVPQPSPKSLTGFDTSGLDSLVTVIRHMHSFQVRTPWKVDTATENPILEYSWRCFESDSKASAAERAKAKQAVIEALLWNKFARRKDLGFLPLATSDIMNQTIWAREDHRLFEMTITRESPQSPFVQAREEAGDARAHAARSLLTFDRVGKDRGKDLERLLKEQFTVAADPVTGKTTIEQCNQPAFIRILYIADENAPLQLDSLRATRVPVGGVTTILGVQTYGSAMAWLVYELVALVRLRSRPDGRDFVQTFWPPSTEPMVPVQPSAVVNASEPWSVEDEDGHRRYMLFYRCSGNENDFRPVLRPHPEAQRWLDLGAAALEASEAESSGRGYYTLGEI